MSRYFLKNLAVEGFRGINNEGDPLQRCQPSWRGGAAVNLGDVAIRASGGKRRRFRYAKDGAVGQHEMLMPLVPIFSF